jgi:predicted Zn finger-like uncharacterized protein
MVIECNDCRARYQMRPSMLRGFKWAEVRCRRCGGTIVVAIPGAPPGTPKQGNRPAHPRGPELPEKEAEPEGQVTEQPPGKVYSLDRWRESRPKRLPTGGYDISGCIRPEPVVSLAQQEPATESAEPPTAPPEEQEPVRSSILQEPIYPRKEEPPPPPVETALPPPDETPSPAKSPKRRLRFLTGSSYSLEPSPSHIVFLYLMLLLLGGCAYLLVRLLSRIMSGGSG